MDINKDTITSQIKAKESELKEFAEVAQKDINKREQSIRSLGVELQNLIKSYQSALDQKQGAIDALKGLIEGEAKEKKANKPKPADKKI